MQKKWKKISRLYISFNTLKRTEYDWKLLEIRYKQNYQKNYS